MTENISGAGTHPTAVDRASSRSKGNTNWPGLARNATTYALLTVAAFVAVFPFFWMVVGATNTSAQVLTGKVTFGDQVARNVSSFFEQVDVVRVTFNSLFIAVVGTVATLAVCSLAGYAFEIFRSRIRERIFAALLLMLSIPFAALMVPLFVLMARAGIINTYQAVILPTVAWIFMIFYFRQVTKAFPSELRDAARIDGLREWQIFAYVYFPVMRSTYAAAAIIAFMHYWNNYLWPLIVLQTSDMQTVTLVVSAVASAYTPDFGVIMVSAIFATLPTLIIFFSLQRLFVQGLLGSLK
jgi:lactose/L-arabinose transport system permease protein